MPKPAASLDALVAAAVTDAVRRVIPAVQRHIAQIAAEQLEAALAVDKAGDRRVRPAGKRRPGRRRAPEELTKWGADRNARRVPNFVVELTGGLDTKKKIVAKFGDNATFEKGKPLPPTKKAA